MLAFRKIATEIKNSLDAYLEDLQWSFFAKIFTAL